MKLCAAIMASVIVMSAATAAPIAEPTYQFRTMLVPQGEIATGQSRIAREGWVSGILVTEDTVRLETPVTIEADYPAVSTDLLFAMAHSEAQIACSIDRLSHNGKGAHLCLADRDGDGQLDSWFPFQDEIVMFEYVRKVPFQRMKPLAAPVALKLVDDATLSLARTQIGFEITPLDGRLELCRTYRGENDNYCTHGGPALDKSGQWQTVTLRGAEFRYRKIDKAYEVQTVRPMRTQRFQ